MKWVADGVGRGGSRDIVVWLKAWMEVGGMI